MIRTIIRPNEQSINLSIPSEYIGAELEILVFPVNGFDSSTRNVLNIPDKTNSRPVPVFGCLKGQIIMSDDFSEPLEDLKEYM